MARKSSRVIQRRAIRLSQNEGHHLFLLGLTGEELLQIADVSRISRDDAGTLLGYQRPEVKRHVNDIVEYLNGEKVLFPNSIILALSTRVRFLHSRGPKVDDGHAISGTIEIPLPGPSDKKPGWIVDGQQRVLAISKSNKKNLLVPVNAFIGDDVEIQRDQFLRVNNTKPLPRGLITELLPEVSAALPANLAARKTPAAICDLLNREKGSPFFGLIKRSSMSDEQKEKAVVADSSIVKMIEESITSTSGCLFPYRNIATGETDFDGIWKVLVSYWNAVKKTFPDAWGGDPKVSRLMHGVGIRSIGRLMDRVMPAVNAGGSGATEQVMNELRPLVPLCHWTDGRWEDLDDLAWNELQNVPRHIRLLSNYLIRVYIKSKAGGA
jgi:DGQHR domain-containing protein